MTKLLRNEKGIALATVLVLSLIALVIISTLLYLVLQGTKYSGFLKRYETAREAGIGAAEIAGAAIAGRGNLVIPAGGGNYYVNLAKACDCGDPLVASDSTFSDGTALTGNYICLCAKLCDPTASWPSSCSSTMDPVSYPDIPAFDLAGIGGADYRVFAQIVDTTIGNSDLSTEQLGGSGVASSSASVISAPPVPYLYRIEINSQSKASATAGSEKTERSRLSVLYAF